MRVVISLTNVFGTHGVENSDEEDEQTNDVMVQRVKELSKIMMSNDVRIAKLSEASFSEKSVMAAIRKMILDNTTDQIICAL